MDYYVAHLVDDTLSDVWFVSREAGSWYEVNVDPREADVVGFFAAMDERNAANKFRPMSIATRQLRLWGAEFLGKFEQTIAPMGIGR